MDCRYYTLLFSGMASGCIGSSSVIAGLKAALDGELLGIATIAAGSICLYTAFRLGQQAGRRRRQSGE